MDMFIFLLTLNAEDDFFWENGTKILIFILYTQVCRLM